MLVIISDLHLTDGTSGETINAGAFRIFRNRLCDLAYDASYRSNGDYRPIKQLDLVLLGDILDLIRSTRWSAPRLGEKGYVKPWHDPHSEAVINKISSINQAILENNASALRVLRTLDDGKTITIPPAHKDKPADVPWRTDHPDRVPVKINIHYMVGNHDWFYHLPGSAYDDIRQTVIDAMGLANPANTPFPHDLKELPPLQSIFRRHKVFARHGDIFDPFNYQPNKGRNASSLGDAIVTELINHFPVVVTQEMGRSLPTAFIDGLKEIDNVRPNLLVPVWLSSLMRRCYVEGREAKAVQNIWNKLADDFLNLDFVRAQDTYNPFDQVDKLQLTLKFSRSLSFQMLSEVMGWVTSEGSLTTWVSSQIRGKDYYSNVLNEDAYQDRSAQYIVYGHSHHHQIVPLDVLRWRGRPFNQMYVNSGTWRKVHEITKFETDEEEFIGHHVMTYLAFFKDDERRSRPFEAWSGALGVA